jgi:tetratricopeptide (TPR) repeat protein
VGAFAKNLRYALRRKTKWLFADWVFSIPPAGVVTRLAVYLILSGILAGCGPAGPRAVLDGKKYLDRGEYQQAIEELRSATELLPTNALAYSYLGLAFHSAGQPAEAERAYQRALALDHDLTEVHYNLGCLWLTQSNRIDQAKSELTAYTMRRPNSTDGWLKLGQAQLRLRELSASEKSFTEALRVSPHSAEALTEIGLVRYHRRRPAEAAQLFEKALKEQPDYAPALLNLAVVSQQDLNDPHSALQRYREYLSSKPAPETAQSVSAVVHQLEKELSPKPIEPTTNAPQVLAAPHTDVAKPTELAAHSPIKAPVTNSIKVPPLVKAEPSNGAVKASAPAKTPRPVTPPPNLPANDNLEVVKLGAEPVIKPADDLANPPTSMRANALATPVEHPNSATTDQHSASKKGFFQKINPINLFGRDDKSSTSFPPANFPSASSTTSGQNATEPRSFPRYSYRSPDPPAPGDRDKAEREFAQGVKAQQARRLPDAIQDYRRAAQADPAYYDAHYNLGLAASENGNFPLALAAYETALAIQPDSLDARYNFGLVLKQAGYVPDAVTQFEKILSKYPNDGRTHLALGNLYAQQLQDPAKARQHYQAVLAIAPQSPQAGAIRYWLTDHPR